MPSRRVRIGIAAVTVGVAVLVLAALGSAGPDAAAVGSGNASASKSVCGLGNGKKATGAPIKLGGIVTLVPGVDFTAIAKITKAYFQCVNDNGGIHGRPVSYKYYTEQLKPDQDAALAKQLVEKDKVLGVVGSSSIIECSVNRKYYKQQGYFVIVAGVAPDCFDSPNFAPVNMGPRFSEIGAAQSLVKAGAKSIIVDSNATGVEYYNGGAVLVGKKAGLKTQSFGENLPITDPNSIITKLVQAAGTGGGVLLDFTPESAVPLFKAAEAQGLIDKVKWASATPIADDATAAAVGSAWNNKILINSELATLHSKGADEKLYEQITKKYASDVPLQSFGQMGYLSGKFATDALLGIKGAINKTTVNAAIRGLKNQKTDILCKPWYYGKLPFHIPNNWDITVTFNNGKVVKKGGCFAIQAVDKSLQQTRVWEKKFKLNTG
jgi:branched-chain amino acid transport system substrate-binding protein